MTTEEMLLVFGDGGGFVGWVTEGDVGAGGSGAFSFSLFDLGLEMVCCDGADGVGVALGAWLVDDDAEQVIALVVSLFWLDYIVNELNTLS